MDRLQARCLLLSYTALSAMTLNGNGAPEYCQQHRLYSVQRILFPLISREWPICHTGFVALGLYWSVGQVCRLIR